MSIKPCLELNVCLGLFLCPNHIISLTKADTAIAKKVRAYNLRLERNNTESILSMCKYTEVSSKHSELRNLTLNFFHNSKYEASITYK